MSRPTAAASTTSLWRVAAALVVAPAVVAGIVVAMRLWAFDVPQGDIATLEIRVLHALHGDQLLGPYSRFGASHPGPLYFYLLAPLYAAMGRCGGSLYVGATLISSAALGVVVWIAHRHLDDARARAVLLSATALLVLASFDSHQPLAIATPWNPYVALLPFAALLLVGATVARGRLSLLPLVVFLHAFTSQTHTAYLIPATAVLASAGLLGWRASQSLRRLGWSVGLAAAAWSPALVDQFWGRGNITRIVTVAFTGEKIGLEPRQVLDVLAAKLALGSPGLLLALIIILTVIVVRGRHDRKQLCWTLAVVALIEVAAGVLVVFRLDKPRDYLIAWLDPIAMVAWTAVVLALLPRSSNRPASTWLPLAVCGLAALVSIRVGQVSTHRVDAHAERSRRLAAPVRALADTAHDAADETASLPPLWLIETHDVWSVFAGVVALEYRHGHAPRLDDGWRNMFGHGFDYAATGRSELYFGRDETSAWVRRRHHPTLELVDAIGVIGNPLLVVDGDSPEDGVTATKSNAARLVGTTASITVRPRSGIVSAVELTAIGDARFTLEGSIDGIHFDQLGVATRSNRGLRTRTLIPVWDDVREPELLRIRVHSGRGRLWIAEVRVRSDELLVQAPL